MADASNRGRIVPIVMPPQQPPPPQQHHSASSSSSEDSSQSFQQKTIQKPEQQPTHVPNKKTRNKMVEAAECLEIPCLNELGLYALPTEGDGNCLYYALSDQLYGDFSHAEEIRIRLADHISSNSEYFMSFIAAAGGTRRAPRRAAASAAKYSSQSRSSSSASPVPPSSQDKEQSFNSKVAESRRTGVWGGAEEIQACCQSFKKDIHVYTMYGIQTFRDVHAPDGEEREVLHIAFHDFHHYSSVRHTDGPHTGMPGLTKEKIEETPKQNTTPAGGAVVEMATPWKISAIQEGLGGKYDRDTIIEMLQQCRGNIDRAFCNLLGEDQDQDQDQDPSTPPVGEAAHHHTSAPNNKAIMKSRLEPSSRSSSPFSTASKRSADDSDSEDPRPAQRRRRPQARERKRRILPDVTVGIAFRDDQNDLVSLRLRVSPEAVAKEAAVNAQQVKPVVDSSKAESPTSEQKPETGTAVVGDTTSQQQSDPSSDQKLRRSPRLTKARNGPRAV